MSRNTCIRVAIYNKKLFCLQFVQVAAWPLYNPTLFRIHDVVMTLQQTTWLVMSCPHVLVLTSWQLVVKLSRHRSVRIENSEACLLNKIRNLTLTRSFFLMAITPRISYLIADQFRLLFSTVLVVTDATAG